MARQAGMTLIELTVVLLVLIGLAGLMIPYVSGFVSKTHDSTGSDSLASLNSAIQRYDVQYMGQPSNYDSLMSSTAAGLGTVYNKLMNGDGTGTLVADDYLQVATISASSLTGVGIGSLMLMDDNTADATFAATASSETVSTAMNATLDVLELHVKGTTCGMMPMGCIDDDAELSTIIGRSVNTSANHYIAFGVGQESGMVGKTISEAPVHFAKTGAMSAGNKYNRILAIYQVAKANTCIAQNGQGFTRYWDLDAAPAAVATVAAPDATTCAAIIAGGAELLDGAGTASSGTGITSITFSGTSTGKAQFLTTAMPMMKLEGLGGALASHYSSMDN